MTTSNLNLLTSPAHIGTISLKNHMVMAPLTRSPAGEGDAPPPTVAEYYRGFLGLGARQRLSAHAGHL